MKISNSVLEAIGYKKYPKTNKLEIRFEILKVFTLRGIVFQNECDKKSSEVIALSDRCNIVVAHSINRASEMLTGDNFVDDEAKWLEEKKAHPPFLLMHFKESEDRILRGGYRIEKDGYIYTYDAFPDGKKEIRKWLDQSVPSLVTSLTVNLSTLKQQVDLIPLTQTIFGITTKGQTLFDRKFVGNASGYVSSKMSVESMNTSLEKSKKLLPTLTKDVCWHFYSALNESDRMKKFLGYFQFIERYTHSTFKLLNSTQDIQQIFNLPERVKETATKFFKQVFEQSKNLSQRFQWCSMLMWENVDNDDVLTFLDMKKIRDGLSHGEQIEGKKLPVEEAKLLALKLLGMN